MRTVLVNMLTFVSLFSITLCFIDVDQMQGKEAGDMVVQRYWCKYSTHERKDSSILSTLTKHPALWSVVDGLTYRQLKTKNSGIIHD